MKIRNLIMAVLLPMTLLCGCKESPEKIQEDSTDMLELAESVLGQKQSVADKLLTGSKLKAENDSVYVKGNKLTAYIKISLVDGIVKSVELGKDHNSRTDAVVTEKVWSKYTENEALSEYALWTGMIATPTDTTYYMKGDLMEQLKTIINMFGSSIPSDALAQIKEAMENDSKSFQLALYELDPETILGAEEVAYKTDFELSLANITQLLTGIDVESATCRMEEMTEGKTYYRVTYTHAIDQKLTLNDLY